MLSGKVVARANRAHILTESGLKNSIKSTNSTSNVSFEVIEKLYKPVLSKDADVDVGRSGHSWNASS